MADTSTTPGKKEISAGSAKSGGGKNSNTVGSSVGKSGGTAPGAGTKTQPKQP